MKREELEKYLKQKVKIQLIDGDVIEGFLRKTGEEDLKNNPNLFIPKNYYFLTDGTLNCVSCTFKTSHVVKISVIMHSKNKGCFFSYEYR